MVEKADRTKRIVNQTTLTSKKIRVNTDGELCRILDKKKKKEWVYIYFLSS